MSSIPSGLIVKNYVSMIMWWSCLKHTTGNLESPIANHHVYNTDTLKYLALDRIHPQPGGAIDMEILQTGQMDIKVTDNTRALSRWPHSFCSFFRLDF